ncbi:MAG: GH92 family glycosyl hydrolase [Bacteroidales bacterium]|nr:GH92 family glycosyl hydrolase [Bacteroidales bacterium]
MKNLLIYISLTVLILASCKKGKELPADFVDPFIGTAFHGHTYPGATTPFGAVQLSPDTRRGNWDACSGYHYSDSSMYGFSHTHLSGTGCIDLGDILFHPTTKAVNLKPEGYIYDMLPFSHKNEKASPGYYKVHFDDPEITAELTATQRVGIHQYTFPESKESKIVIDLAHSLDNETINHLEIEIVSKTEIAGARLTSGWTPNQHIYFVARFSKPFSTVKLVSSGKIVTGSGKVEGKNLQAIIGYETAKGEKIDVNVGTSLVSIENARLNLEAEAPSFSFDEYRGKALNLWNDALSAIIVEGNSESDKINFYTAIYHSMVVPNVTSDVNGDYRTHDMQIKQLPEGQKMYLTLSIWDTYRAWNPLMTIINKELTENIIHSMLAMYETTGELPIWPLASGETGTMIGYHSVSVIWDAYQKGIRGFDAEKAFEAMVTSSNKPRKGGQYYLANGYIPSNFEKESVSCVLEYAYDDWCIAQMAQELGKEKEFRLYSERALNYIKVFDGSTGFFRGKRNDGNWVTPFNPMAVSRDYTEATAWQYRFYVPHDVNGMIQMLGGRENFASALDKLFIESSEMISDIPDITGLIGQYAHGNEPSHHVAYLYNYAGQPWKTQEKVRYIQKELYKPTPDGIPGNEDCGQMSAWYALSSLGIYPVCPGSGEYAFSAPLFEKATVKLNNGKTLAITANTTEKNMYIEKILFNGQEVTSNFITHKMLMDGGTLAFTLSDKPNKTRGSLEKDAPQSMSKDKTVSIPFIEQDLYLFLDEVECSIGCSTKGAEIRYTLDGTEPGLNSPLYSTPFKISRNTLIKARAFKEGYQSGPVMQVQATKAVMRVPDKSSASVNGVNYRYFEGKFSRTGDMLKTPVINTGILSEPSIKGARTEDFFGFEFAGYIFAPEDGYYEFYTESDDGSVLYIGESMVVENDGSHGAIKATGKTTLKKGYHKFLLLYFEDYEGNSLEWGWKTPQAQSLEPIKNSNLFIR